MIKIDGVDIPTIKYIDPVDGEVDILRVMKDGVQIWPEIIEVINTPTGIQIGEYEIGTIDWDYAKLYAGAYDNPALIEMYVTNEDLDLTSIPFQSDFSVKVNDIDAQLSGFTLGSTYIRLTVNSPFNYGDEIKVSYTAGTNPLKAIDTGNLVPNLVDQVLDNVLPEPSIDWDYTKMYIGEGENANLVTLYFTGQDADVTSIPGNLDWVLYPFNVINTVTVYTDRVELLVNTAFTSVSSVAIDYTPGVNPLKDIDGYLLVELNDQALNNILP